jgi:predicted nucleic acid-binding protein
MDHGVARRYGDLVATLKRLGTPIPTNDVWIAAVAIEQNGELLTRDEHFKTVPVLRLYG